MANYSAIKAAVNAYIKANGKKEITGRILNSVLNATIDSLGRYFQFAGGALPTDDPGTPDQNVCYLAGEPGVYTNFGGIAIENEEVALLFWDGEWTKQRVLLGIQEVEASVDNQVGTPSVDVSYSGGQLVLTFHNLKGEQGEAAGFGTIGADITGGVGTPGVSVETSGSNTAKNLMFHFTNLKGDTGVTSVVATIDNTSGTPSCQVSLVNGVLTLAFSGLKGLKGDTGVSADYPITIYNGLDSDATDQALAAAQGKVLDGKISQLGQEVVQKALGKNLYDGVLESGYFKSDGTIEASSVNSHTKNYIPVEAETQYHISRNNDGIVAFGAAMYICFYNEQRQFLSAQTFTADGIKNITTPANCYFLRTTIRNAYDDAVQIEKGSTRTAYEPYNPISRYLTVLPNNSVGIENINPESFDAEPTNGSSKISRSGGIVTYVDREAVKFGCKNIYDNVIDRGYFKQNGTIDDSGVNYHTVNYLPVLPNTQYHLSSKNNGYVAFGAGVYICYYDSGKNFLSSESFTANGIKDITTPQGCYYIRTTVRLAYNDEVQIELGNARTAYVPYNPIYNYLGGVRDMENELKKVTNLVGADASVAKSASLSADTSLTLPGFPTRLKKRLAISFTGKFSSFSFLSIGQNYKTYDGAGIKIDGTNVYAMNYSNGTESIRHTVPHGIPSFANYISVTLYIDSAQTAFVTIVTDGGSARVKIEDYNYAHSGTVFANPAMAMTDVKLNATCADFRCPVWAFGDSYFGLSIERVGYWLRANGFFNILFDGLGGETATGAMSDLNLCLNYGTPKYIIWALGMNGAADSNGQPNATWLAKSQELIALCAAKGITPIFCTIPTVPGIVHEALSAWVRNSGYRCIDVADAVGSQADGTWYDGMLSSDNVHPTEFGAKVIAQRWLIDFPEIMEYGIVSPSGENALITV